MKKAWRNRRSAWLGSVSSSSTTQGCSSADVTIASKPKHKQSIQQRTMTNLQPNVHSCTQCTMQAQCGPEARHCRAGAAQCRAGLALHGQCSPVRGRRPTRDTAGPVPSVPAAYRHQAINTFFADILSALELLRSTKLYYIKQSTLCRFNTILILVLLYSSTINLLVAAPVLEVPTVKIA